MRPPIQRPRRAVCALCLLAAASIQAAPFATTYTGTIGSAGIPGVASGQGYAVTLVFDNGGSTAASQQWTGAHLTCAIWRMNGAAGSAAVYAQDLAAHPPSMATLSANTDGNGALTAMFNAVAAHNVPPGSYSATPHIEGPVSWFVSGTGPIFSDHNDVAQTRDVFDTPLRRRAARPHLLEPAPGVCRPLRRARSLRPSHARSHPWPRGAGAARGPAGRGGVPHPPPQKSLKPYQPPALNRQALSAINTRAIQARAIP